MIKNTSGIDTQYCVYPEKYMPYLDNYMKGFEEKPDKKNEKTGESKVKFSS